MLLYFRQYLYVLPEVLLPRVATLVSILEITDGAAGQTLFRRILTRLRKDGEATTA